MDTLIKYGHFILFIAGLLSLLTAAVMPESRLFYIVIGIIQIAAGVMLMNKSRNRS